MTRTARKGIRILLMLMKDQQGGEALEYALVAGMIVVGAMATIACVGTKLVARWSSLNNSM